MMYSARGGGAIPALYTILCGNEVRQTNQIESVLLTVNGPITFYFTDEHKVMKMEILIYV